MARLKNRSQKSPSKQALGLYDRIYAMVRRIPAGRVASYGQIAALCGSPRAARIVGWALHVMSEEKLHRVPWHRVINRNGEISTTCSEHTAELQCQLLEREGVRFDLRNGSAVDFKRFGWNSR